MATKPYLIMLASQKGGVGKSAVALNLAVALTYQKHSVLLVDSDIESASISEQLGVKPDSNGYIDIVNGDAKLGDSLFAYQPLNLSLIPGSPSKDEQVPEPKKLQRFYSALKKVDFDFVVVDSPPGIFSSNIARYFDDVAIVTTPDTISATDSARIAAYCQKYKLEHRLIINRMGYSKYDLEKEDVERLYGDVAFQIIPDDKIVSESIMKRKPAYMIDRNSYFSIAIDDLARAYSLKIEGAERGVEPETERETKPSFFEKLGRWVLKTK